MLVRSAGRRQHRHSSQIIAASFAQLNLPWLAPAQLRWSASHSSTAAAPSIRARRHSVSKRQQPQVRHLATPAGQYNPSAARFDPPPGYTSAFRNSMQDRNVPWDFNNDTPIEEPIIQLRRNPVIIDTTMQMPPPMIRLGGGLKGTSLELLQHLHTCLRVGRADRAEAIIRRLAEQVSPASPELLHAHSIYLEHLLENLKGAETPADAETEHKEIQRWFEVEVRGRGTQPDSKMLVVMIRAATTIQNDSTSRATRERAIQRYAHMAQSISEEALDDVLYSEDYDDVEFMVVGRATTEFFEQDESDFETSDALLTPEPQQSIQETTAPFSPLEEIPEVLPTSQKGGGLSGIKRAMDVLKQSANQPSGDTVEAKQQRQQERQVLMEEAAIDIAVEQWRTADMELKKIGISTAMQSKPVGALMWEWLERLLPDLRTELAAVKKALKNPGQDQHDRLLYGPYLELLPLEKVAAATVLHTMTMVTNHKATKPGPLELQRMGVSKEANQHDIKLGQLTITLGKVIEQESQMLASKERNKRNASGSRQYQRTKASKTQVKPHGTQKQAQSKISELEGELKRWPDNVRIKLGAMLVSKLIETAHLPVTKRNLRTKENITQMQPAFHHRVKYAAGKKIGTIVPNAALIKKIESEPLPGLLAKRMPMIVEPKPWTGWQEGGYLRHSTPVMRLAVGDKMGKTYFHAAQQENGLDQVFDGLNALSKVPWKVNQDVFKVQLEAWNSGEDIANFAPLDPQLDTLEEPDTSADPATRRRWLTAMQAIENKRTGLHSKRCFQNFQLEIARAVANETLYFPHNLDFRGRAYPIPPYFNHMGADNVRALVVFSKGKPLGEGGLRWLKIHLATVAGYDKASLDERVAFTEKHLGHIYDSVQNPLGGKRWWLEAEDAWQTIAACFELTKALDSPDPTQFISHLPIHQDGTCNGLQHYAALGGDEIGARQVNLEPGDRPADVYTAVADAVKEEVRKDAEAGNPVAMKLHGRVTRKCVKQPVMTNVYGVTFFGAKAQVRKQLEVLFPEVGMYDEPNLGQMSHYIATKIFLSLGTMFKGAQAIQTWLGQCADRISSCLTPEQIKQLTSSEAMQQVETNSKLVAKSRCGRVGKVTTKRTRRGDTSLPDGDKAKAMFKSTVVWTTPLNLPVVQPYRTSKAKTITTNIQSMSLQAPQVWDPVSKRKQLQAFPPNFIHSLDATHMLLSATKCTENGLTFASIHDSFWTHAADVDQLSSLLRDAFVEMHSDDIIGRLREEFQARYKGCMQLTAVDLRSVVGRKIAKLRDQRKSNGRTSQSAVLTPETGELAQEAKRLRLLESEDAEEREQGEAMVTPGSIFASEGDESAFVAPAEMESQQLGEIPKSAETDIQMTNSDADDSISTSASATSSPKKKTVPSKTFLWLPITFPEVPEKGSFDVRRLRDSKYFFH